MAGKPINTIKTLLSSTKPEEIQRGLALVKEEITASRQSTASLQIAKEVKAGNCACDIKNPKGECCLGDVNSFVKSLTSASSPSPVSAKL